MTRKHAPIQLPARITKFGESMVVALDRNFSEIQRLLSQLQVYENKTGVPINATFYFDPATGDVSFAGNLRAATGTFEGELVAATGTFSGELSAAGGTFTGELSAVTGTFKELMAGTAGGARLESGEESGDPYLRMYDSNNKLRVEKLKDKINFYDENADLGGVIYAWYFAPTNQTILEIEAGLFTVLADDPVVGEGYMSIGPGRIILLADDGVDYTMLDMGTLSAFFEGDLEIFGDFSVHGVKAATVKTETYGYRKTYAVESPDNRFCDIIQKNLKPGKHWIELEPMFAETISEYIVFSTVEGEGYVKTLETRVGRFLAEYTGPDEARVSFMIYGKRKGYENVYMEPVEQAERTRPEKVIAKNNINKE